MGVPAIFVRLAFCNLRCYFCDTDFESDRRPLNIEWLASSILQQSMHKTVSQTRLVVITGGEPMLQNLVPFVALLVKRNFIVQIETAGTVWVPGLSKFIRDDKCTLVCSPKTGDVNPKIKQYCEHWKYIVSIDDSFTVDGIPAANTQSKPGTKKASSSLYVPEGDRHTIWMQPQDSYHIRDTQPDLTDKTLEVIEVKKPDGTKAWAVRDHVKNKHNAALCASIAQRYNYRVSLQMHKILDLP